MKARGFRGIGARINGADQFDRRKARSAMANTESGTDVQTAVVANRAPGQGGMTAEQASTHEARSARPTRPPRIRRPR